MIEIIKFALSDFWVFVGFATILNIFLFYTINGIVKTVAHLTKKPKQIVKINNKDTIDFALWLQDNYSQNKREGDFSEMLPKGYMRKDFTNDTFPIIELYKDYIESNSY